MSCPAPLFPLRTASLGRWLIPLLLIALLVACGGTKRVLGPPGMSVQEIELLEGHYWARVRLDSPASMPLELASFAWKLSFNGSQVASASALLDTTLAPVAGDVVRIDLGVESALPQLRALGTADTLDYILEGELQISKPKVRYPIRYQGRLRATPGKPGSYR